MNILSPRFMPVCDGSTKGGGRLSNVLIVLNSSTLENAFRATNVS